MKKSQYCKVKDAFSQRNEVSILFVLRQLQHLHCMFPPGLMALCSVF